MDCDRIEGPQDLGESKVSGLGMDGTPVWPDSGSPASRSDTGESGWAVSSFAPEPPGRCSQENLSDDIVRCQGDSPAGHAGLLRGREGRLGEELSLHERHG